MHKRYTSMCHGLPYNVERREHKATSTDTCGETVPEPGPEEGLKLEHDHNGSVNMAEPQGHNTV